MKFNRILMLAIAASTAFVACKKENEEPTNNPSSEENKGVFQIKFDHKVGAQDLSLSAANDSVNFMYQTNDGQDFNITNFGYYVTEVRLTGPNGESYSDEMEATAAGSKGYYHVLEDNSASQLISLSNIPEGTYDQITFTLGVKEEGVQSGASGGVLDIANGAWFWNWNAGYIGFSVEGFAANSNQDYVDFGGGFVTHQGKTAFHIGGWKDVPDNTNFTNNIRTVTLDFGTTIEVRENLNPQAHVIADVLKFYDNATVDFSSTYAVHSPGAGAPFADHAASVFSIDHVHQ